MWDSLSVSVYIHIQKVKNNRAKIRTYQNPGGFSMASSYPSSCPVTSLSWCSYEGAPAPRCGDFFAVFLSCLSAEASFSVTSPISSVSSKCFLILPEQLEFCANWEGLSPPQLSSFSTSPSSSSSFLERIILCTVWKHHLSIKSLLAKGRKQKMGHPAERKRGFWERVRGR